MQKPAQIVDAPGGRRDRRRAVRRTDRLQNIIPSTWAHDAKASLIEAGRCSDRRYEVAAGFPVQPARQGGGYALKLPVIDISEVAPAAQPGVAGQAGAEGGPHSGARAGAACYGAAHEPTVTDATSCSAT